MAGTAANVLVGGPATVKMGAYVTAKGAATFSDLGFTMGGATFDPRTEFHLVETDQKLGHLINNASGTLRPLVEKLLAQRLTPEQLRNFLTLVFYPAEVTQRLERDLQSHEEVRTFALNTLRHQ